MKCSWNALWEIRNGPLSNLLFPPYSDVTVELPLTLMHPKPKGKKTTLFSHHYIHGKFLRNWCPNVVYQCLAHNYLTPFLCVSLSDYNRLNSPYQFPQDRCYPQVHSLSTFTARPLLRLHIKQKGISDNARSTSQQTNHIWITCKFTRSYWW